MINKDNNLDILYSKYKQRKKYKIKNILLVSIFCLLGVISIMDILIILNKYIGFNIIINCLSLFSLTSIYSSIVNIILEKQDKKLKDINMEIKELESNIFNELDKDKNLNNLSNITSLELRFDGLTTENKLKLLNYIKSKAKDPSIYKNINIEELEDSISLIDNKDKYKRKKKTKR